jgi:hypothetical protein
VLSDPGPDAVFVHAAGVRIGPRLVLLIGGSGSGKSTLTAMLLRRGHPILGDDVLRFAPRPGFFDAVPRSIKLDHEALDRIGWDGASMPYHVAGTYRAAGTMYVSPAAVCEHWYAGQGRPWGVVVLDGAPRQGPARLARRGEGEAAVRLLQSVLGVAHVARGGASAGSRLRLLESLRDAVAYDARGADPAGLADLIVEAAQS